MRRRSGTCGLGLAEAAQRAPAACLGQIDDAGHPPQQADEARYGVVDEGALDNLVTRTARLQ